MSRPTISGQDWLGTAALLLGVLVFVGCDPQIDLFKENEFHYSIFGYLDASADTQYVRIEPLRDGLVGRAPSTLDAEVSLTHRPSGRTLSPRDSLFREPARHIFYTTADIEPSATYQLEVEGPDGATSRVETTTPAPYPEPDVLASIPFCFPDCRGRAPPRCESGETPVPRFASVLIEGVEHLVAVRVRYDMRAPQGAWLFGHLADTVRTDAGNVRVRFDYARDWCNIPAPDGSVSRLLKRAEVIVAAGSSDWPPFLTLDLETELKPNRISNVDGGVGYFGGIVSDTVAIFGGDQR